MSKAPFGFLCWLVAVTLWLAWSPFEGKVADELEFALWTGGSQSWGHLLLLVPLVAALAVVMDEEGFHRPLIRAFGMGTLIGLFLELGQLWIRGRSVSLDDMLANILGAAFAVWIIAQLRRRGAAAGPLLVSVGLIVFVGMLTWMIHSAILGSNEFKLKEWNPEFFVLSGVEFGGERKYEGRVWNAQICGGEPSEEVCINPEAGAESRGWLTQTVEKSQRVEVSACVLSSSERQSGPARIVTFSIGPTVRNLTLAQQGRDLIFRVRTPLTGPNGTDVEFVLPDAVQTSVPTSVAARFERGVVTIQAESEVGVISGVFRPDFLPSSLRLGVRTTDRIPDLLRGRGPLAAISLLLTAIGYCVGWLFSYRWRWLFALSGGPAVAVAGVWGLDHWLLVTLPPSAYQLMLVGGIAELGVVLALWDFNRRHCC